MGFSVLKGLRHRADDARLRSTLIGLVTVVPRFGVKLFGKLTIIPDQSEVPILNRDITGRELEDILIYFALLAQFTCLSLISLRISLIAVAK